MNDAAVSDALIFEHYPHETGSHERAYDCTTNARRANSGPLVRRGRLACPLYVLTQRSFDACFTPLLDVALEPGHDIGIEPTGQLLLDRPIEEAALGAGLDEEFGRIRGIDIVIAEGSRATSVLPAAHIKGVIGRETTRSLCWPTAPLQMKPTSALLKSA